MNFLGMGSILDIGSKVIDRVWPDPDQRAKAKLELYKAQQAGEFAEADRALQLAMAQLQINAAEAANSSVFVAGWRPFIGWVCGIAFTLKFVLGPAFATVMNALGYNIVLPALDITEITALLAGMLGIGGLRTIEKIKGVKIESYDKLRDRP